LSRPRVINCFNRNYTHHQIHGVAMQQLLERAYTHIFSLGRPYIHCHEPYQLTVAEGS
jgi:hypothetical protein